VTARAADSAPPVREPLVGVVVLNWNGIDDTLACLDSLRRGTFGNYELVLVDNGSDEAEVERLRQLTGVTLIEHRENVGFTRGNNAGIRAALARGCSHVLLLNNDTVVEETMLERLVGAVERDPRIGIVGPKIHYFDEPGVIWFAGGTVDLWRGESAHVGMGERDDGRYDAAEDVDYVTACAMLVKRAVFEEIGGLETSYFIYFDETDFCVRARRRGFRVVMAPDARLLHRVSRAMGSGSARYWFHFTRSRVIFLRRHASRLQRLTAAAWILLVDVPRMNLHFVRRRKLDCVAPFLRALVAGLRSPVPDRLARNGALESAPN